MASENLRKSRTAVDVMLTDVLKTCGESYHQSQDLSLLSTCNFIHANEYMCLVLDFFG